jgi:N-acetylmuramoyl-L-alanine amidase
MRRTVLVSLAVFFSLACALRASEKNVYIKIRTDGRVRPDIELALIDGMGYLKARDVSDAINASLDCDKAGGKAVIRIGRGEIRLLVDSPEVVIDGTRRRMNKRPLSVSGELWVPLELVITRAFSEFSGFSVDWDFPDKTLTLLKTKPGTVPEQEPVKVPAAAAKPAVKPVPVRPVRTPLPGVPEAGRAARKMGIIVVDPGHGGKDPGAIGALGTREKDVALKISKRLAKELRRKFKAEVFLTREDDVFIPLKERTAFANKIKADLFISVHANASLDPGTKGFEIYFLSEKASDIDAQSAANLENSVLVLENDYRAGELDKLLGSLALAENMNESAELCGFINAEVPGARGARNRRVKQAGFYVLRGVKMPALLVETAYISNPSEEKKLRRRSYSSRIAGAVCDGLEKWEGDK